MNGQMNGSQRTELTQHHIDIIQAEAEHGTPLYDALVLCGFKLHEAEELTTGRDVREAYVRGVARGQSRIRQQLARAAESGNVSAAKALRLMETPDQQQRAPDRPSVPRASRAEQEARYRRWKADFDMRWEVFRALSQIDPDAENCT